MDYTNMPQPTGLERVLEVAKSCTTNLVIAAVWIVGTLLVLLATFGPMIFIGWAILKVMQHFGII